MREEQIHIPVRGTMAYARLWNVKGQAKANVIFVHGSMEHSQRYQSFALFLAHNGYNVLAYDLRGHGYTAVSTSLSSDPIFLHKQLANQPDFGYIPASDGWSIYLDDLSWVLEYVKSRFPQIPNVLYGHSMGAMIVNSALGVLPEVRNGRVVAAVMNGHPSNGGLKAWFGAALVKRQIAKLGDDVFSSSIDRMVFGPYGKGKRFRSQRTELDWISSVEQEVDSYIADPLCGHIMRLGFYSALIQGNRYVYSRQHRRNLSGYSIPVLLTSGGDDPVSNFGKSLTQLSDMFRRSGWSHIKTKIYDHNRHEILHDSEAPLVFEDVLSWLNKVVS